MRRFAAATLLAVATPAAAQDEPRFCPNNPSLESSACTTEPGRVHVEVSALDWQLERDAGSRTDTIFAADTLVRVGIFTSSELQVEWSPYGRVRAREDGAIERRRSVGDVTLAWRQNLRNPDGKRLSFGVQPFVTVPAGRRPVGDGTWSAGMIVPVTYDLTDTINVGVTAEADAAADEDGHGRHFSGNAVAAVSFDLSDMVSVTSETQLLRDDDPGGASTQWVGGLGLTWKTNKTHALYAEAVAGLNRAAPDVRLYAGIVALF